MNPYILIYFIIHLFIYVLIYLHGLSGPETCAHRDACSLGAGRVGKMLVKFPLDHGVAQNRCLRVSSFAPLAPEDIPKSQNHGPSW